MMTRDTIMADLALRGWELIGAGCWYWVKQEDAGAYYIRSDMARVQVYAGKFPVGDMGKPASPQDEEDLRRNHDIICRFERGDYEPTANGSPPNIARVDSTNAPERLGIQNDRPEYGGASYRKTYPARRKFRR